MNILPPIPQDRPLDPMADSFIKYLFGSEENKDLLQDFINAVFTDKGLPLVKAVTILNPYQESDLEVQKEIYLDVKAADEKDRFINIEVQVYRDPDYIKRSLYYWASAYYRQLKRGENYERLSPVVVINLMDFPVLKGLESYHSCFRILEESETDYCLTNDLEIHFIEIPKLLKRFQSRKPDFHDKLVSWCYYLKYEGDDMAVKIVLDEDKTLGKAHKAYKHFTEDEKNLERAWAREKFQRDQLSRMVGARREGLEQGRKEGLAEGMEKGMEKGERKKAFETARKMKQKGFSPAEIAEITGLLENEILELD